MKSEDAVVSIPNVDDTKNQVTALKIDPATIRIGPPNKDTDISGVPNKEFISAIFSQVPDGAFAAVCSKPGDPTSGGWSANLADNTILPPDNNNYI